MKGVILAGGTGSRLDPLTRITNKHLLPIYDRPMISYAMEALSKAGVEEIMLITGGAHAGEFLRLLGVGDEYGVSRLLYAYQERAAGIADALSLAERFVGNDCMVVMLADNVFEYSIKGIVDRFKAQVSGARVVLGKLKEEHLRHVGVPEMDAGGRIIKIWEKPQPPPSQYGVAGLYFYPPDVFEMIAEIHYSARGELEITDVNNLYIAQSRLEHDFLEGYWGDAGESIDAYYQVCDFVRKSGANKN